MTPAEAAAVGLDLDVPIAELPTLTTLEVSGTGVAAYLDGAALVEVRLSPRPFLHPVRTLAGTVVSDAAPADHPWHLGVCIAVQDVAGSNLWGGRTYVRDQGYVWREDHGRMAHREWLERQSAGFVQRLDWLDRDGRVLLHETRTVTAEADDLDGVPAWRLRLRFRLATPGTDPVLLGSPGSHGRVGGGYGGMFWRLPMGPDYQILTANGTGEDHVHGRQAPWVAVVARPGGRPVGDADPGRAIGDGWSIVLAAGDRATGEDPWFVRTSGYPGLGSSLAATRPVEVGPDRAVEREFVALVIDHVLTAQEAERWHSGMGQPRQPAPEVQRT